jgi:hypothetical protein
MNIQLHVMDDLPPGKEPPDYLEKYLPSPRIKVRVSGHQCRRLFTMREELC